MSFQLETKKKCPSVLVRTPEVNTCYLRMVISNNKINTTIFRIFQPINYVKLIFFVNNKFLIKFTKFNESQKTFNLPSF